MHNTNLLTVKYIFVLVYTLFLNMVNDSALLHRLIKCFKNSILLSGPNRTSERPSYFFSLK